MPESEIILSWPPPTDPSAEDQPFHLAQRKPDDQCMHVDLIGCHSLFKNKRGERVPRGPLRL